MRQQVDDVISVTVTVSDTTIQTAMTVKSLGVTLDNHLTFDQHIFGLSASANHAIFIYAHYDKKFVVR
jgi:hypothetical protein